MKRSPLFIVAFDVERPNLSLSLKLEEFAAMAIKLYVGNLSPETTKIIHLLLQQAVINPACAEGQTRLPDSTERTQDTK